jgi:hypothetical protein
MTRKGCHEFTAEDKETSRTVAIAEDFPRELCLRMISVSSPWIKTNSLEKYCNKRVLSLGLPCINLAKSPLPIWA